MASYFGAKPADPPVVDNEVINTGAGFRWQAQVVISVGNFGAVAFMREMPQRRRGTQSTTQARVSIWRDRRVRAGSGAIPKIAATYRSSQVRHNVNSLASVGWWTTLARAGALHQISACSCAEARNSAGAYAVAATHGD